MRIKGSTIIIFLMYVTWIAYLFLQIWCKQHTNAFLPAEVTYGTAALFIVETVSLARLKMAKEGASVPAKTANSFLQRLGLGNVSDFENEVQAAQARSKANGQTANSEQVNQSQVVANNSGVSS